MVNPSPSGHHPSEDTLKRQIGLGPAAAAVAGEAIAVGIFLTPAAMARSLASPMWLLIVWLLMGAMALTGALCYGTLASRFPRAGGGYVFLRESYGPRLAFLYGWMSLLVMDPGVTAALAVGLAAYVGYITPLSPLGFKAVAVSTIVAVAAVNIRKTAFGAGFLEAITWLKFALLGLVVVWGLAFRAGDWSHFTPFVARAPGSPPFLAAFAGSSVAAFYSFGGWWDVSKIAGEVRDPQRTLPRALMLGVIAVTFVYVSISAAFLYLVPVNRITSDQTFVAQAGEQLFGTAGGKVLSAVVVACVLGSIAALIITSPRVYYAMARDGVFFHGVAKLHPRFGTPARAIALQAMLASALVLLGRFEQIIAYFLFIAVLFIGLTVAGVFRLPDNGEGAARVRPWAAWIFLSLVVLLLAIVALNNPWQSLLGAGVVAVGAPVYQFFKKEG